MSRKAFGYDKMVAVLDRNIPSKMTGVPPRDSDKEMLIQVLQFSDCKLTEEQIACIRQFHFESLTRGRRKLQRAGLYHGSPEVMRKRRIKGYEVQQTAPKENASGLVSRISEND